MRQPGGSQNGGAEEAGAHPPVSIPLAELEALVARQHAQAKLIGVFRGLIRTPDLQRYEYMHCWRSWWRGECCQPVVRWANAAAVFTPSNRM